MPVWPGSVDNRLSQNQCDPALWITGSVRTSVMMNYKTRTSFVPSCSPCWAESVCRLRALFLLSCCFFIPSPSSWNQLGLPSFALKQHGDGLMTSQWFKLLPPDICHIVGQNRSLFFLWTSNRRLSAVKHDSTELNSPKSELITLQTLLQIGLKDSVIPIISPSIYEI